MAKVELKNVKTSKMASKETECFQASVYLDGVKIADVQNDGHGGSNRWHPWAAEKQVEAVAKATARYVKASFEVADAYVGDLLALYQTEKDIARWMKTSLVFVGVDGKVGRTGKCSPVQIEAVLSRADIKAKWLLQLNAVSFAKEPSDVSKQVLKQSGIDLDKIIDF